MTRTRTRIDAVAFTLLLVAALSAAPVAGAALGVDAGDRAPAPGAAAGPTGSPTEPTGSTGSAAIDAVDASEPAAIDATGTPDPAAVEANNTYRGSNLSFTLDGTTLEVSVSADAFEGNDTNVTVRVADADPYENLEFEEEENGVYTYDVDLTDRSFGDLSDATVTVERSADDASLGDGEGDLWYVALANDGAQFDDQNRLVVPIDESVGLEGDLLFTLEAGDQRENVYATRIGPAGEDGPDRLRFVRSAGFDSLIRTGEDVEIGAADDADAPRVGNPVTVSPSDIAGDPRVLLNGNEIAVMHPLIVSGDEYVVTIEGTIGDRSPTTTRRVTAENGGEVRFSAENLVLGAPGSEATVTIEGDGGTIGSGTTSIEGTVLDASVDANTSIVTVDGLGDALGVSGTAGDGNESDGNGSQASSLTVDVYVSWAHNGSRELVLVEDVPADAENGTLAFPEAGYALTGGGHELLIVTDENATAAASIGGSVNADTGVEPMTGGIGGGVGLIGMAAAFLGSTIGQILIGFLAVVVIGGIGVLKLTGSSDSNGSGGSGGRGRAGSPGGGSSMMPVSVALVDANGDPVDTTRTVVFEPTGRMANAMKPQKKQIAGSGEVHIPSQQYYVSVDGSDTGTTLPSGQESIRVQVPPQQGTITVHSARDEDQRIADAEIRCLTPEDVITTDVNGDELRTDRDGTTTLELPPSADPDSVTLEVEHDRYESAETGLQRSIGLEPKTGTLTVETGIDGQAAGNVPVSVRPTEEFPRANDGGTETRSGADGEVTIDDLVIGEYRVTASFTSDAIVDVDETSVEVVPDEPRRVSIDGAFDFDLAPYRSRIDELNEEIADLTRSNRDGAIQYYYGSVLTATLDLLSEFPDQGLLFVEHGVDPDEVTEAVLSAVADAIEYTRDAMTTKQNVDLFGACSSLRNERIRWEGDPSVLEDGDGGDGSDDRHGRTDRRSGRGSDRRSERGSDRRPSGRTGRGDDQRAEMLEELIAVVAAERADHRGRTADRLEETEAFLSERRGEVATVSPVREQYDRITNHLSSNPGETRTEKRVQFVVATWMLDAVRRVFDHPALVDRLEETVF